MLSGPECTWPQTHWRHKFLLQLLATLLTTRGVMVVANVDDPLIFV
jgi:hypothetical protein